ncbi:hypothetical protein AB0I66_42710 [Streptomyces sp. NPDC050439]|uniref:DUF7691 family protein n=1 Tax=unclassified Streptomyces TaxID=2593676 RepID=UPI00343AFB8C
MSKVINFNPADQADVVAFLGAADQLTADQQRILGYIREAAEAKQRSLDRQGVDWGLTIPDALDHLIAGWAASAGRLRGQCLLHRPAEDH